MTEHTPTGQVPEGTQSQEWITMSAAVAYALWNAERAARKPTDGKTDADAWADAATDYRAQVRYVLRELEKEGIRVRNGNPADALAGDSEEWRKYSARAAWLLWLKARRSVLAADETREREVWEYEAADQRRLVRSVLVGLATSGIHFLR